jgi:hypothetical protein
LIFSFAAETPANENRSAASWRVFFETPPPHDVSKKIVPSALFAPLR